jgi:glycosyltransferase involved in cell wall biosynthesis
VLDRVPDARFVLVGDGELRAEVERQIAALGLADKVFLAGWQRDMPAVYAALDLLALSSRNEGTPVSVIEALAAGVPVVATDVGGVADVVVSGQTGLLAPVGDVGAMSEAISGLLGSPERARSLAQAGRHDVLARFGLGRLIEDMESLYLGLLEEKGVSW